MINPKEEIPILFSYLNVNSEKNYIYQDHQRTGSILNYILSQLQ